MRFSSYQPVLCSQCFWRLNLSHPSICWISSAHGSLGPQRALCFRCLRIGEYLFTASSAWMSYVTFSIAPPCRGTVWRSLRPAWWNPFLGDVFSTWVQRILVFLLVLHHLLFTFILFFYKPLIFCRKKFFLNVLPVSILLASIFEMSVSLFGIHFYNICISIFLLHLFFSGFYLWFLPLASDRLAPQLFVWHEIACPLKEDWA